MRTTLHLVAADEYPAYAEVARRARLRSVTKKHADLDLAAVERDLRAWLRTPRTNVEIRRRMARHDGIEDEGYAGILLARTLLPLVQLPPAGFWADRGRGVRFAVDPRPRPPLDEAAAIVLRRYLAAFGPASRRDVSAWADAAQADLAGGLARLETVEHHAEDGRVLLDLPGAPLPPDSTPLPVRFLSRWDQALLAYADRERIIPAAVAPLKLTLSGDQTVTVDGRVAASWAVARRGPLARLTVTPHVPLRRGARGEIRAEAKGVARFVAPGARKVEVAFSAGT